MGPERLPHRYQEVTRALGNRSHRLESATGGSGVALGANPRGALELPTLDLRVDALELDLYSPLVLVAVDADDDALAALDVLREAERRVLDLVLHEALLDGRDGTPQLVDATDELRGVVLELSRDRLDRVRAA